MRYTRLGPSGPVISSVGLGSLALTGVYGHTGAADADRLIRSALDAGVTLLDTAGFYAGGQVESLIGRAVAGREEVVVTTRGGVRRHGPRGTEEFDGRPGSLDRDCDASLRRLRTGRIDLFYLDCQDERLAVEPSVARLSELVAAGKIGHLGLTGGTPQQVRRAHAVHPITALAVEYSLWGRRPAPGLLATVRELGIAVVAARPLGRGFLTGRMGPHPGFEPGDWRHADPRFGPAERNSGAPRLKALEAMAARLDVGAGRLALSWLLAQDDGVVPVPSTRDPIHLEMNLAASSVELPAETREALSELFPACPAGQSSPPLL
ncbi:aldo/keto reductase [Nonomuraea dietziae]|uniref:Aryl-alcohol dehydrogenase-like predicted oxidoreductase n=1 Tax=Nonomuraea dietziae TaxID=65515 RepID=A0A7W5VCV1_9ACTN|nr:aldo/keto reductase [Nonomuraea dietziae]MBB3725297.1 aryl-alcohol dehydrogenase-like predicted oxidoreductase [Nonomuraea dietziae]